MPSGNCLCSHKFGHVIVFKTPSSLSSSHYQANVLNLLSQSPSLSSSSSSSPGRCSLPLSWQGSWFESGSGQEGVLIDGTSISHKVTLWLWWRPCWWKIELFSSQLNQILVLETFILLLHLSVEKNQYVKNVLASRIFLFRVNASKAFERTTVFSSLERGDLQQP